MILKSNTEFGDYIHERVYKSFELTIIQAYQARRNFDNFLKQPLEIWMFVPCELIEGVWVVLEEPEFPKAENRGIYDGLSELYDYRLKEYQQAKERVLFEGFVLRKNGWLTFGGLDFYNLNNNKVYTIENIVDLKPELTPTAIKQIQG